MAERMVAPAQERFEPHFDVLSYPRHSVTEGVIVDVANQNPENFRCRIEQTISPSTLYLGATATGGTASEVTRYYLSEAESYGLDPGNVTLVTNRASLREPVLESGMGMVHVTEPDGVDEALDLFLDPRSLTNQEFYEDPLYSKLSYEDVVKTLCRPGTINVVGFVGRTGAGKSTAIDRLQKTLHEMGGQGGEFELDAFFIKSRAERKAWLSEPCISDEEKAKRGNVASWWNFDLALETLDKIRAGEHVHLEGLYDMEQDGEKVGVMDIDPSQPSGYTVFVEGTTLLMPVMCEAIDSFVYLNTHDRVRTRALMERNLRHGYTAEESRERKRLTDAAETQDHISRELRVNRFARGRLTVLDNSDRANNLTLLPPYIPQI